MSAAKSKKKSVIKPVPSDMDRPQFIDTGAVARLLCVSRETLRRWIALEIFPKPDFSNGGKHLWHPDTYRIWAESKRRKDN